MELFFIEMWKIEGVFMWDKCYEISFEYIKISCLIDF